MKSKSIIISVLTVMLLTGLVLAQPGRGYGRGFDGPNPDAPRFALKAELNLTDAQEAELEKLRLEHQKKMELYRGEMDKLRAEYHVLLVADEYSKSKIESKIAEMNKVQTSMQLENAAHINAVRAKLTDEQKVKFDQHVIMGNGPGLGRGHGKGFGPRGGNCPDCPCR